MLSGMTHTVGPKGQVVIPKDLRDAFGIEPGDEVTFYRDGDHVAVRPTRTSVPLKGRLRDTPLIAELERERAAERGRDGRRQ